MTKTARGSVSKIFSVFAFILSFVLLTFYTGVGMALAGGNNDNSLTIYNRTTTGNNSEYKIDSTKHVTPPGNPIAGTVFTLRQVESVGGVNVVNNPRKATEIIKDPTGEYRNVKFVKGFTRTLKTDKDGKGTFSGLPNGLYKVIPSVSGNVSNVAPFYVILPVSVNGKVSHDINVYPKGSINKVTVAVDDTKFYNVDSPIYYTIHSTIIPKNVSGNPSWGKYVIEDNYSKLLDLHGFNAALVDGSGKTIEKLQVAKDFRVADNKNGKVSFTYTNNGLNKIAKVWREHGSAASVRTNFTAKLNKDKFLSLARGTASRSSFMTVNLFAKFANNFDTIANRVGIVLPNNATFIPSDALPLGIGSNTVNTKLGSFSIVKVDSLNNKKVLPNASFAVFATKQDANRAIRKGVGQIATNTHLVEGQLGFINSRGDYVTVGTTDSKGELFFGGLRYSDFENNTTIDSPDRYYLVEVAAPKGYKIYTKPIKVVVDDRIVTGKVENTAGSGSDDGSTSPIGPVTPGDDDGKKPGDGGKDDNGKGSDGKDKDKDGNGSDGKGKDDGNGKDGNGKDGNGKDGNGKDGNGKDGNKPGGNGKGDGSGVGGDGANPNGVNPGGVNPGDGSSGNGTTPPKYDGDNSLTPTAPRSNTPRKLAKTGVAAMSFVGMVAALFGGGFALLTVSRKKEDEEKVS